MKLNIQRFAVTKSTTFTESDLNPQTNTSTLKITITFSANNSVTYFSGEPLECTCNGVKQTKTVSHPAGGQVQKTFTFKDIQHDSDGSKEVSWSWKCATGTSVIGTIKDSGTQTLTTLHTPPVINSISFTEEQPILKNMVENEYLDNDVFVLGLSQKKYTINAEYETGSTYGHLLITNQYGHIWNPNIRPTTQDINVLNTTNDILNLANVELKPYIDETSTPTIDLLKLKYTLYDDKNGKAETQYNDYEYIQYTNLSLTASVKRDGQTSGDASISCNGNYYNGEIGNINQGRIDYYPTIEYKVWKSTDSEPANYTLVTSGITKSVGTYSLQDYNIGSSFDPRYSYRIKIKVSDNFTSIESSELTISVGEATWTEFDDYVDFKQITIRHKPIVIIDSFQEYTGAIGSGSNGSITYDITKAGYTPIGIVGIYCDGTRSSYINIYAQYISSNTEAEVYFKNTHPSNALASSDTNITIYVAYIRS